MSLKTKAAEEFVLPTEPNKPINDWRRYAYLIYGEKKIGKTSLFSEVKGSLFLQFDKAQLSLPVIEIVMTSWRLFRESLRAIEKTKKLPYPMVVIDGVDIMYQMCMKHVCAEMGIDHPADGTYGKGWDGVKREFSDAVDRLLKLPCGVAFIAHSTHKEIELRDGRTIERMVPAMSKQADSIVNGKVDGWFCYDYVGEQRVLVVSGRENVNAGHRIRGHFMTTDGKALKDISMGRSSAEAFHNFMAAFDNEIEHTSFKKGEKTDPIKTKKSR